MGWGKRRTSARLKRRYAREAYLKRRKRTAKKERLLHQKNVEQRRQEKDLEGGGKGKVTPFGSNKTFERQELQKGNIKVNRGSGSMQRGEGTQINSERGGRIKEDGIH